MRPSKELSELIAYNKLITYGSLPSSHESDSRNDKSDHLGERVIAAVERAQSEPKDVSAWVKNAVALDYQVVVNDYGEETQRYDWNPISPDDPFLVSHREEVVREAIGQYKTLATSSQLQKLANTLSGREVPPEEIASKIALANPYLVMEQNWLYPDFRFGKEHIDSIMSGDGVVTLVRIRKLIEPECYQYVLDKIIEQRPSCICAFMSELPVTVKLSEQQMMKIAEEVPNELYDLRFDGRLPEVITSVSTLRKLNDLGYCGVATMAISSDLLSRLSLAELGDVFDGNIGVRIVKRLVDAGRLDSEDTVYELLSSIRIYSMVYDAKDLPVLVQSCVFKTLVTDPNGGSGWCSYVGYFGGLQGEDYEFLLDSIDDLIKREVKPASLREVFRSAGPEAKQRFAHEVEPKLVEIEEEARERGSRNEYREQQRGSEDTYFDAGNFTIGAYGYEEELSDKEIIEAFEHEHCVRYVGVLQDIANDTTRTNGVTCVKSLSRTASDDPGAEADRDYQIVCTEHEALQQLLKYLDNSKRVRSCNTLFDDLTNNLSYIGEKEYAEAVKGIAAYWKWFLDKDSENQLYVDTVVTDGHGRIKSDVYMFDRILEHFSNSEMEKYEGKLITKEIDILQDDPSKIKVVLLDDWTISGSQLRSGYSRFVKGYPTLAQSIEVQLIVASAERVAMGIEKVTYRTVGAQSDEEHVPIVTRAYYLAHKADVSMSAAVGARITGSHSSVDYGFINDISMNEMGYGSFPLLANVIRPYHHNNYVPEHVRRLEKLYGIE